MWKFHLLRGLGWFKFIFTDCGFRFDELGFRMPSFRASAHHRATSCGFYPGTAKADKHRFSPLKTINCQVRQKQENTISVLFLPSHCKTNTRKWVYSHLSSEIKALKPPTLMTRGLKGMDRTHWHVASMKVCTALRWQSFWITWLPLQTNGPSSPAKPWSTKYPLKISSECQVKLNSKTSLNLTFAADVNRQFNSRHNLTCGARWGCCQIVLKIYHHV